MASSFYPHDATSQPSRRAPAYYAFDSGDLTQRFKDFDNPHNFAELEARVRNSACQSFVLDYGREEAWCALDLSSNDLTNLINTPRPAAIDSRWIHISYPHIQEDRVKTLAKTYQFSPRLTGLMYSKPLDHNQPAAKDDDHHHHHHFHWRPTSPKSPMRASVDTEQGRELAALKARQGSQNLLESLSHYDIVNAIWHWSSIDVGKKHLCLGYNALHKVTMDVPEGGSVDLPNGQRIWTWLVLCDDKTVISIVESSLTVQDEDATDTRHNLLNVFRQLSKATDRSKRNPISIVPVRYSIGDEDNTPSDTAGLLFYYLFDDWFSTYSLLAKSEHQYGAALYTLREEMMKHAHLSHVDRLFRIGRQLATLKRMYQSYELLIGKVLDMQQDSSTQDASDFSRRNGLGITRVGSITREMLGVNLSPDVLVRFERLRDRIRLYVLSEIQECVDTKDALLLTNFNLISIKEADGVEQLTRITTLVTIMFLPVSLMTGYFSVQIPEIQFTLASYWISFAVVLSVSFVVLVLFGILMEKTGHNMIVYRPIHRVVMDVYRRYVRGEKKEE